MSKKFTEESSKEIYKQVSESIVKEKIIILLTGNSLHSVLEVGHNAREKGLKLVGIDFRIPGVKDSLKSLKRQGQKNFGVFFVTTKKETRIAINAGAMFIFSPHSDKGIIRRCRKEKVFHAGGALTPTEVFNTNDLGADSVSIFPCGRMGGLSWFIFLKNIFPRAKLIPTDTMNPFEAGQYIKAGAYAVAPVIDLEKVKEPDTYIKEFMEIRTSI
ncbi:MAG TPA: bifunctional 4-hydroxy-2-oxoglutarate aldolase/2-dehydro-3-deoxy-phosphogluconate aldolase [Thermodesulfobacteriota bacterium]|nr:bifunctional 4-hydroxy-2-oxoglutarate aldolase/2-dehydro-3-deoxy-phosphogluconate aldolase [Thermodesulfobacteriota bacterium]